MPGYTNPQNLNRYSYVRNNPLRYTDPTGHMQCEEYQGVCLSEDQMTDLWDDVTDYGNNNDDNDDDDEDNNLPVPEMPGYDPIAIYCGDSSTLGCTSYLLQDGATLVDIVGMGVISTLTITGCVVGTPGGGILAGCVAGGVEGLFFYNTSGLNTAESILSALSSGVTALDDYRNYGGLEESSRTSITTTLVGLVMIDPFTDAAIDGYASGYNHGLFNGIDHIYNGLPIIAR